MIYSYLKFESARLIDVSDGSGPVMDLGGAFAIVDMFSFMLFTGWVVAGGGGGQFADCSLAVDRPQ